MVVWNLRVLLDLLSFCLVKTSRKTQCLVVKLDIKKIRVFVVDSGATVTMTLWHGKTFRFPRPSWGYQCVYIHQFAFGMSTASSCHYSNLYMLNTWLQTWARTIVISINMNEAYMCKRTFSALKHFWQFDWNKINIFSYSGFRLFLGYNCDDTRTKILFTTTLWQQKKRNCKTFGNSPLNRQ